MKTIKIKVEDLLTHLQKNREKHVTEFNIAMSGYRKAVWEKLKELTEKAERLEDIHHTLDVIRPQSFIDSYDEAISMLQWTTDTEVELDRAEFKQYVQDEWSWANVFAASTRVYK